MHILGRCGFRGFLFRSQARLLAPCYLIPERYATMRSRISLTRLDSRPKIT